MADDHYNYLAEKILAMPEGERPTTAAYAAMAWMLKLPASSVPFSVSNSGIV